MTLYQRVKKIIGGIVMILYGIIVTLIPNEGYMLLLLVFGLYILFSGVKMMIYYFTMARLMVGGRSVLMKSIILLDAGMFTLSLSTLKPVYLILYLVGIYAVTGVIDILRSLEEKKLEAPVWKLKFISGLLNIIIALAAAGAGIFLHSAVIPVYIYGGGMIWSGIVSLISAFRKSPSIYIQ